jgi:hypothetical protein
LADQRQRGGSGEGPVLEERSTHDTIGGALLGCPRGAGGIVLQPLGHHLPAPFPLGDFRGCRGHSANFALTEFSEVDVGQELIRGPCRPDTRPVFIVAHKPHSFILQHLIEGFPGFLHIDLNRRIPLPEFLDDLFFG